MVVPFELPPVVNESFCSSTSSSAFGVVSVLNFYHSNRWIVVSDCCYILNCLITYFGAYFHMLIYHPYAHFDKVTVQIFCPFFNLFVCLLLSERVFVYSDKSAFSDMFFANIISQFCLCIILTVSFIGKEILILRDQFISSFFHRFGVTSKKSLLNQRSFVKSFYNFIFMSVNQFVWTFTKGMWYVSNFFFYIWMFSCYSTICWKDYIILLTNIVLMKFLDTSLLVYRNATGFWMLI